MNLPELIFMFFVLLFSQAKVLKVPAFQLIFAGIPHFQVHVQGPYFDSVNCSGSSGYTTFPPTFVHET